MKTSSTQSGLPQSNPIANILVIIVGTLVIGASVVLGFFAFLIITGIVLVLAAVIGIRVWWFNRTLRSQMAGGEPRAKPTSGGIIEGEYRVVADDDKDE